MKIFSVLFFILFACVAYYLYWLSNYTVPVLHIYDAWGVGSFDPLKIKPAIIPPVPPTFGPMSVTPPVSTIVCGYSDTAYMYGFSGMSDVQKKNANLYLLGCPCVDTSKFTSYLDETTALKLKGTVGICCIKMRTADYSSTIWLSFPYTLFDTPVSCPVLATLTGGSPTGVPPSTTCASGGKWFLAYKPATVTLAMVSFLEGLPACALPTWKKALLTDAPITGFVRVIDGAGLVYDVPSSPLPPPTITTTLI